MPCKIEQILEKLKDVIDSDDVQSIATLIEHNTSTEERVGLKKMLKEYGGKSAVNTDETLIIEQLLNFLE